MGLSPIICIEFKNFIMPQLDIGTFFSQSCIFFIFILFIYFIFNFYLIPSTSFLIKLKINLSQIYLNNQYSLLNYLLKTNSQINNFITNLIK